MRISEMMTRAMFPDAVEYRSVRGPGMYFNAIFRRDGELPSVEAEAVKLERITQDPPHVYAGMSRKFRTVVYYECEEYEEYPDDL